MLTVQTGSRHRCAAQLEEGAFFYVDGIPTKGLWIDLEDVDGWHDIHQALVQAELISAGYAGEILVADVEGALARACYASRVDTIDLGTYITLRDSISHLNAPAGAAVAFINWYGSWDSDAFENAFMGVFDSEEAYAETLIEENGMLAEMPEYLRCYFDVERFARDLFIGDYYFDEGYVFSCNC